MTIYVAQGHPADSKVANYHTAVTEQVADLLVKAELVVKGAIKISGQSMPSDYIVAEGETWSDVAYAIEIANQTIEDARKLRVRKRLEAVL